jgi:hypothetical protein
VSSSKKSLRPWKRLSRLWSADALRAAIAKGVSEGAVCLCDRRQRGGGRRAGRGPALIQLGGDGTQFGVASRLGEDGRSGADCRFRERQRHPVEHPGQSRSAGRFACSASFGMCAES